MFTCINWPPFASYLILSNWHMMQTCCVYLIYGGLGFSHLTLRIFAFQTAACFICHLKVNKLEWHKCHPYFTVICQMPTCEAIFSSAQIGGKLKVFLLGAIYTRKPQNGGKWAETSWSCTSCITSIPSMILMWSPVHDQDLLLELSFD